MTDYDKMEAGKIVPLGESFEEWLGNMASDAARRAAYWSEHAKEGGGMKQQEVLEKMRSGWELSYADGIRSEGRTCLQQGGAGKGGPTLTVSWSVLEALRRKKLIETVPRTSTEPFWRTRYRLAEDKSSGKLSPAAR